MINQLLNKMYHLNIQIKDIEGKTKLIYEPGLLDQQLKEQIRLHKDALLIRMSENHSANKLGFLVFNHGALYEYRYGLGAFLYIERLPNGKVSAWRENYLPAQERSYKVVNIAHNVPFDKAFEKAEGFIIWLSKKQKMKVG